MSGTPKILILDDDVDLAEGLADILEMQGYDVMMVHTGVDAVEAYKKSDFDVSFFDVRMPGMNGVESFMKIREMKPQAKIYMMTGYSVEDLLQQALQNGALGVMRKPFEVEELITKLDDVASVPEQGAKEPVLA